MKFSQFYTLTKESIYLAEPTSLSTRSQFFSIEKRPLSLLRCIHLAQDRQVHNSNHRLKHRGKTSYQKLHTKMITVSDHFQHVWKKKANDFTIIQWYIHNMVSCIVSDHLTCLEKRKHMHSDNAGMTVMQQYMHHIIT